MTRDAGTTVHVPAFSVQPTDTTGAGDSFNAGFLHAYVRRLPIRDSLLYGNGCGALSTRALGGTSAQPTLDELTVFIGAGREGR